MTCSKAWRSACVGVTSAWNAVRGKSLMSWLNMLQNGLTREAPSHGRVQASTPGD
jgi:hypothetical protein